MDTANQARPADDMASPAQSLQAPDIRDIQERALMAKPNPTILVDERLVPMLSREERDRRLKKNMGYAEIGDDNRSCSNCRFVAAPHHNVGIECRFNAVSFDVVTNGRCDYWRVDGAR